MRKEMSRDGFAQKHIMGNGSKMRQRQKSGRKDEREQIGGGEEKGEAKVGKL